MEKRFHINDRNVAGRCRVTVNPCRFAPKDDPEANHYSSLDEARAMAEEREAEAQEILPTPLKKMDYSNSKYELEIVNNSQEEHRLIFEAWMKRDGVTVGYFKGAYGTTEYGDGKGGWAHSEVQLISWTVETNPKYRNQGVARQLIKELKKHFGVSEIMSGGSYTPEGLKYWSKYLTLLPMKQARENWEPMDFIGDWEEKRHKRPDEFDD